MLLILIKNVRVFWVSRCIKNFLRVPTQSLGSLELLITCVAQYSQKNPFKFHNYLNDRDRVLKWGDDANIESHSHPLTAAPSEVLANSNPRQRKETEISCSHTVVKESAPAGAAAILTRLQLRMERHGASSGGQHVDFEK